MTADNDKTKTTPSMANKPQEPEDALRHSKEPERENSKVSGSGLDKKTSDMKSSESNRSKGFSSGRDEHGRPNPQKKNTGKESMQAASKSTDKKSSSMLMSTMTWLLLGVLILVVILSLALWWQHQRFEAVAMEVATRLQTSDERVVRIQKEAQQALSIAKTQTGTVTQLQRDVRAMRSEMAAIDQAWESTNRGLDDKLLMNNARRLLNMAEQQLMLMGNVQSAIMILESAQNMLERQTDSDKFVPLAKAIGTDLARLRATPEVNVTSLSSKLDQLVALTSQAPLLVPDAVVSGLRPIRSQNGSEAMNGSTGTQSASTAQPVSQVWWKRWIDTTQKTTQSTLEMFSREFADLMQIRRAEDPQALLLSEEQAMVLRANVRSMLLSAQLALLSHQKSIWTSELTQVQSILDSHYDSESTDVKAALTLIRELVEAPILVDVGTITDSLSALALASQSVSLPATSEESR